MRQYRINSECFIGNPLRMLHVYLHVFERAKRVWERLNNPKSGLSHRDILPIHVLEFHICDYFRKGNQILGNLWRKCGIFRNLFVRSANSTSVSGNIAKFKMMHRDAMNLVHVYGYQEQVRVFSSYRLPAKCPYCTDKYKLYNMYISRY